MVSTGTRCAFRSTEETVPFLTWMMRSAIGAIAVLCVMITTVIPVSCAVSCSSLRIAFFYDERPLDDLIVLFDAFRKFLQFIGYHADSFLLFLISLPHLIVVADHTDC